MRFQNRTKRTSSVENTDEDSSHTQRGGLQALPSKRFPQSLEVLLECGFLLEQFCLDFGHDEGESCVLLVPPHSEVLPPSALLNFFQASGVGSAVFACTSGHVLCRTLVAAPPPGNPSASDPKSELSSRGASSVVPTKPGTSEEPAIEADASVERCNPIVEAWQAFKTRLAGTPRLDGVGASVDPLHSSRANPGGRAKALAAWLAAPKRHVDSLPFWFVAQHRFLHTMGRAHPTPNTDGTVLSLRNP